MMKRNYDFVFGFSPGYSGTTSLSRSHLYGRPGNVIFLFESGGGSDTFVNIRTEDWREMTFQDEYKFVKDRYIPFLIKSKGNNVTLVDLGHHNLYLIDALVKYLKQETKFSFLFVRIRRARLELAISIVYDNRFFSAKKIAQSNLAMSSKNIKMSRSIYRYWPYDRTQDVQHKPPTVASWTGFSNFQKALWMVDEVEARWKRLVTKHPDMDRIEVSWSKLEGPNSFLAMATIIGDVFNASINIHSLRKVNHVHAGSETQHLMTSTDLQHEDRMYVQVMRGGLYQNLHFATHTLCIVGFAVMVWLCTLRCGEIFCTNNSKISRKIKTLRSC